MSCLCTVIWACMCSGFYRCALLAIWDAVDSRLPWPVINLRRSSRSNWSRWKFSFTLQYWRSGSWPWSSSVCDVDVCPRGLNRLIPCLPNSRWLALSLASGFFWRTSRACSSRSSTYLRRFGACSGGGGADGGAWTLQDESVYCLVQLHHELICVLYHHGPPACCYLCTDVPGKHQKNGCILDFNNINLWDCI